MAVKSGLASEKLLKHPQKLPLAECERVLSRQMDCRLGSGS